MDYLIFPNANMLFAISLVLKIPNSIRLIIVVLSPFLLIQKHRLLETKCRVRLREIEN